MGGWSLPAVIGRETGSHPAQVASVTQGRHIETSNRIHISVPTVPALSASGSKCSWFLFLLRRRKAAPSTKRPCLGRRTWCRDFSVQVRPQCHSDLISSNPLTTLGSCLYQLFLSSFSRYRREHHRPEGPPSAGHGQGHALPEDQRYSCSHFR